MFQLFQKLSKRAGQENPVSGKMAGILAKGIRHIQTRFATTLSEKERQLTIRQKKKALWIFCIGMSGLSAYWIYDGIFSHASDKPAYLKHQAIAAPPKTLLPDSLDLQLLKQFQQRRAKKDSLPDSVKR